MIKMYSVLCAVALAIASDARDIVFPPVSNVQHTLGRFDAGDVDDGMDLSTPMYSGLITYANLEYVHCLAADAANLETYDIAVIGAPFDTGVTARPGARFGPNGIRQGSRRISPQMSYSVYTGRNHFREWAKIVDCGDAPLTFLDNTIALKQLTKAHKVVSARKANSTEYGVPRIITLGGDHTTTLPALRSTFDHWGAVSVIHWEACRTTPASTTARSCTLRTRKASSSTRLSTRAFVLQYRTSTTI